MVDAPTLRVVTPLAALLLSAAATDYETPPVLEASKILPTELLKSDVHTVRERVLTAESTYHFTMESRFGLYAVESRAMLEVRVHEVKTLARVVDMNQKDEFFAALGERLEQTANAPVKLLEDPVGTLEEIGEGIGKQLEKIGSLFEKREKSKHEDPAVRELLVGQEKRELAAELNLDVYSTNPKVQEFLDEIAGARAGGTLTVDAAALAIPGGVGIAIGAAKFSGQVEELLRDKSPSELHAHNEEKLTAMGFDGDLVGRFLDHGHLSPRHKTVLVAGLEAMEGVAGREVLLEAALDTDREAAALFHERRAVLLAQYHDRAEALQEIELRYGFPVATTRQEGNLLLLLPVDIVYWSQETATALRSLAPGGAPGHFVVTGCLTARAREETTSLGFVVQEGYRVEQKQ
ncbi:MAG: hypothetical protein ACYSWT_16700 [Planctomycetota bacterium]|jgi:hypothetical protein